ncbi:MAG: hypothetical protein AAGK05_11065, partial [Pseudomonadota bacterium]
MYIYTFVHVNSVFIIHIVNSQNEVNDPILDDRQSRIRDKYGRDVLAPSDHVGRKRQRVFNREEKNFREVSYSLNYVANTSPFGNRAGFLITYMYLLLSQYENYHFFLSFSKFVFDLLSH